MQGSWPQPRKDLIELPPLQAQGRTIWKIWMKGHFLDHGMPTILRNFTTDCQYAGVWIECNVICA